MSGGAGMLTSFADAWSTKTTLNLSSSNSVGKIASRFHLTGARPAVAHPVYRP